MLIENNIHLEVCATSNIQTNVFNNIEEHPADFLYRSGISMSINTDARTISETTLTHEYSILNKIFGWNEDHFYRCNLEALRHSFATPELKAELQKKNHQ